jgi:hypothetical protein
LEGPLCEIASYGAIEVFLSSARARFALRAATWHLVASALVAALAASLVFGLWYPYPYRAMAGGEVLFMLVVGVDLVSGPLLTSILFTPGKSRRELTLDLSLVVCIQVMALIYGLYSVALARPVILAFEVDRFRVIAAADVQSIELPLAPDDLKELSWIGPKLVGTRAPRNSDERLRSIDLSLQGREPGNLPGWWQPYSMSRPEVMQRAKPLGALRAARPSISATIDSSARKVGLPVSDLSYLPLVSHKQTDWIVLLDRESTIRGFAPVDGF